MKKILTYIALALLAGNVFAKTTGFMMRNNGPLRVDNGKGGVEWSITVPEGTKLTIESEEPVVFTLITEKERIPDIKFYKVTYDKKTYYARDCEVALGSTLGVVLSDTAIFTKPAISSFLNAQLEQGSVVVVGAAIGYAESQFTEIQYWSSRANSVRKRWVFTDKISMSSNDLEAVRTIDVALSIKNKDPAKELAMKEELFKNARKLKTKDEIAEYIQKQYNKALGIQEIEAFYGSIVSDDGSNINVRKFPVNGEVVGQLSGGNDVLVSKKSTENSTIEGVTDCWYYVCELAGMAEGAEGWVFGKYVKYEISEKEASEMARGSAE